MTHPTFNDIWKTYESEVMPPNVSEIQRKETKRAFFAGGHGLFSFFTLHISQLSDEEAEKVMCSLEKQFQGFCAAIAIGEA